MTKPTCLLVRNAAIPVQRIVHRAGRDTATARGRIAIHHRDVLSMDVAIITRDQEEDDDDERASNRASSTTQ
jgi:hypothetical protein